MPRRPGGAAAGCRDGPSRTDRRLRWEHGRWRHESPNGPQDFNITVLVDFENDSAPEMDVARALGPRLWGVRLDTSGQLVDRSCGTSRRFRPARRQRETRSRGAARRSTRTASSASGSSLRVVSRVAKIDEFERRGVPVDAYGVGSSLIRGENDFTADIVLADGRPVAQGRPSVPAEPAPRVVR